MPDRPSRERLLCEISRLLQELGLQTYLAESARIASEPPSVRGERSCRQDIRATLEAIGRRLTTSQVLSEMSARNYVWGERTIRENLARMVEEGELDNDPDARPRGYGLL